MIRPGSNLGPISHRFLRYGDLLAENRNFFTFSYLAPPLGVTSFEFMETLYGS